ncbi:hypothetical protein [Paenibacillus sp. MMS18-CY102]|uniref:hypothetical protein n=1 Tax=Paenibacillus sp. MMS18-CY102 TaxID=2682849 RepID=UPI00136621BC|nr:hypothetical protein [Paenibacillus sp. MMS18-CY102]MWC29309.1 hypothetical protein [Paenibacillus sp. MMS18-CY102]
MMKKYLMGTAILCLQDRNLMALLKWVYESEIYVHYWNVDMLYIIADEIAQELVDDEAASVQGARMLLGDMLYPIIKKQPKRMAAFLHQYTYPNVNEEQIQDFWERWILLFDEHVKHAPSLTKWFFDKVIREKLVESKNLRKQFSAPREDYIILEHFLSYYASPLLIFSKSFHLFDTESEIMKRLESSQFVLENKAVQNYKFIEDSKLDLRIQICDVLVGCLSWFFTFLKNTNEAALLSFALSLNKKQKISLSLLCEILRKSFEKNPAFTSSINSATERENLAYIMGIFSLKDSEEQFVHDASFKDGVLRFYQREDFIAPIKEFLQRS